jgi:hypothetical protein
LTSDEDERNVVIFKNNLRTEIQRKEKMFEQQQQQQQYLSNL